ncbi:DUF1254 domain-containing protein [Kitasatospora sp. NPDC094016]|uniref:DUF1254 domain-containing protein n=1 Tax=Kitasatospora sp. NPDC094016 TaxID=3154986 RepID=UPI003322FF56
MTSPRDASLTGDETIETSFGTIRLEQNYPTDESSALLLDQLDLQRACQAYLWFLPLIGAATWRDQAAETFGASGFGDFVVYQTLREKRGILTANLTTPYIGSFLSLADGPVLFDYPAGPTAGGVLDFWQRPAVDLGQTGPDGGEGGGYVVLGPDADATPYEDSGRVVARCATVNCLILFRVLDSDPKTMESIKDNFRIWREGSDPAPARFIEDVDREWSATPARGLRFWQDLDAALQQEPVREVDKGVMAMLEPLGIAPGQPFAPDARQKLILENGAALGELMARANQVNPRYTSPYWEGTGWYKSFDFVLEQETDTVLQLDERATWFYEAVGSSEGMVNPSPRVGQVYMTTKRDGDGKLIRADRTYRLHVPAGVPVAQFWSLTLYSEATRRPYDNGGTEIRDVSLDSRDDQLAFNDDGSIDLYIGPTAPDGAESNWMKTTGDDGWFVYFRLYGPTEAFFDKTWALPDFTAL